MTSTRSRTAEISNPKKRIFPGFSKEALVGYYGSAADAMLPHIEGRPLSLYRFPAGWGERGFYQKNRPEFFPEWVHHRWMGTDEGQVDYIIIDSGESLLYVAAQVAEFHVWTSRADAPGRPDKIVFDLDPGSGGLTHLRGTARKIGKLLGDIGLSPHLMTTGKKGYHVAVPIKPEQGNDEVRGFALKVARAVEADDPSRVTTELLRDRRGGRLFIDVNRNSPHQTSIAPYSVRATEGATVALPIGWGELKGSSPGGYDIEKVLARLRKKPDPWAGFDGKRASLKDVVEELKK